MRNFGVSNPLLQPKVTALSNLWDNYDFPVDIEDNTLMQNPFMEDYGSAQIFPNWGYPRSASEARQKKLIANGKLIAKKLQRSPYS